MKKFKQIFFSLLAALIVFISACGTHKTVTKTDYHNVSSSDSIKPYSKIFGTNFTGTEDKKLLDELSTWMGTPYVFGGKSKQGTDCSGMVQSVYKTVYNISLYRTASDIVKNCDMINKKNLQSGDLVFFKIKSNKITHIGIYLADNKFIHASSSKGVTVNDLTESYYSKYFYSGGRVKNTNKN